MSYRGLYWHLPINFRTRIDKHDTNQHLHCIISPSA